MCRHLGYVGPETSVGALMTSGANSLRAQSWAPTDMRGGGTINADGFGAAWWVDGAPSSYRNAMPIWTDPAVDDVLTGVRSTAIMAAVRSATVGMPVERSACAPFTDDRWAFSHNGVVFGWPEAVVELVSDVPAVELLRLPAPTDSAALWVILRSLLMQFTPDKALQLLISRVLDVSPTARLNLMLSDGDTLYATTVYHSLSVRDDGSSVTLASEPLTDGDGWQPIADHSLIVATPGSTVITELDVRTLS